jgi:hypothetical protein
MNAALKFSFVCQMLNPIDVNHAAASLVHKKSSFSMKTMQNIGGQVTAGNKTPLADKIIVWHIVRSVTSKNQRAVLKVVT